MYEQTYDRIYAYAYRHTGNRADAEDVTGLIFESALKAFPRFRLQERPLLPWLYTIAARRVADFHRAKYRTATAPLPPEPPGPAELAEHAWELAAVHEALERLSPSDRQIIDLHFFAGLSHSEVAQMLDVTVNAATVRLHRALKRLATEVNIHA